MLSGILLFLLIVVLLLAVPLSSVLANSRNSEIALQPDSLAPAFELDSSGRIRIALLRLIYLAAGLLLPPTT